MAPVAVIAFLSTLWGAAEATRSSSLVVVHGSSGAGGEAVLPTSVQAAWDNHFSAFGKQDLDKIMLDYDETSVVRVWDNSMGQKTEYRGMAQVREMFSCLFADLSDLSTLKAPVVEVEEDMRHVFLVGECPGCGYNTATDTFLFGPDLKIKRQNIVITKVPKP